MVGLDAFGTELAAWLVKGLLAGMLAVVMSLFYGSRSARA